MVIIIGRITPQCTQRPWNVGVAPNTKKETIRMTELKTTDGYAIVVALRLYFNFWFFLCNL